MKTTLATILIALSLCLSAGAQTKYTVKLITVEPWTVGEAKPCSFDGVYNELHCFEPTKENVFAKKRYYLVDADFDKPVQFNATQWDIWSKEWPYGISCRLDSISHATCAVGVVEPTARDYFNELNATSTFNRYADEYVCFNDEDNGNFAVIGRTQDMLKDGMGIPKGTPAELILFRHSIFVRNYAKGTALGDVTMWLAVKGSETDYDIEFNEPIHNGRMVYSITWVTGRYVLRVFAQDKSKTVPVASGSGKCLLIHPTK